MGSAMAVRSMGCHKLSVIGAALVMAVVSQGPAKAGFVNNAEAWTRLPPEAKAAYVQGINDAANYVFVDDGLPAALVKAGRTRCLIERQLTASAIVDRISQAYAQNPGMGSQSPYMIYVIVMASDCKSYIDQERQRIGLPPS